MRRLLTEKARDVLFSKDYWPTQPHPSIPVHVATDASTVAAVLEHLRLGAVGADGVGEVTFRN